MQEIQSVVLTLSLLMACAMFIWGAFLGLWFLGAPPFHKSPVLVEHIREIPVAACPRCGYKSTEFTALVARMKREEGLEDSGQSDMLE